MNNQSNQVDFVSAHNGGIQMFSKQWWNSNVF